MGDLREVQRNWDTFGRTDPLWAVLTDPANPERRGIWEPDAFFRTGEEEVERILALVSSLGLTVRPGRALDFGCGVGRLSQALARTFDRVDGVDIAPSMLEAARSYDRSGGRVQFHLNDRDDLRLFDDDTFDFVYTNLVLQHMEPRFSRAYLAEFARLLRPDGVLVFVLPSGVAWGPMPDDAYHARLTVGPEAPRSLAAGAAAAVEVTVTNTSGVTWDTKGLAAGNHWHDRSGGVVRFDDGRAPLTAPLPPGGSVTVSVPVTAPDAPGAYRLGVDIVHEYVCWFAQRGVLSVEWDVAVTPAPLAEAVTAEAVTGGAVTGGAVTGGAVTAPSPAAAPAAPPAPAGTDGDDAVMEMHFIPVGEVRAHLGSYGLDVVDAARSDSDGTFVYHRYVARKATATPVRGATRVARATAAAVAVAGRAGRAARNVASRARRALRRRSL